MAGVHMKVMLFPPTRFRGGDSLDGLQIPQRVSELVASAFSRRHPLLWPDACPQRLPLQVHVPDPVPGPARCGRADSSADSQQVLKSEPVASGLCFTSLSHLNLGWDPDRTLKLLFFPPSWSELLPLLEQSHGAGQCFSFENNVFPTNVILAPPKSETLHPASRWHPGSQLAPGVNILAHLYQEPSEKFSSIKRKLIVNPRGVISPDVHALEKADFGCVSVDRNVGRMYHTRYQSEFTGGHGWFRLFGAVHIDCSIF